MPALKEHIVRIQ
jgi:hypothetical protein